MYIDLTGTEYLNFEADKNPGKLSILTRAVPGVAKGELHFVSGSAPVQTTDVIILNEFRVRETCLDITLPWQGIIAVDTAESTGTPVFERKVLHATITITENEGGTQALWQLLYSVQNGRAVVVVDPCQLHFRETLPAPKTRYAQVLEDLESSAE